VTTVDKERTVPRLMLRAAEQYGDALAIDDATVRLTFTELTQTALQASRAFLAAGIERGDRVAVWAPNIHEWIVCAIGLQAAGGVLVPLNTRLKGAEAGYILAKSGARMLCTVAEFLETDFIEMLRSALGGAGPEGRPVVGLPALERIVVLQGKHAGAQGWREFLEQTGEVSADRAWRLAESVDPDDVSDILFTSGTTGKPKGVMTCHGQNLRAFASWSELVGLSAGDRYLIVNPFFHSFGYKAGWIAAIMRGATILPQLVFDVPTVLERISRDRVSVLPGPPALYQSLLAHPERSKHDLSSLRLAVTGAAAIPVELVQKMRDDLGFKTVITGYGLTEACGIATMCRYDDDPETIATTSGRAIPHVEVCCADPAGNEVARGEPGEVLVRGYNIMQGYFEDEAATAETVDAAGWLHTGDIGVMDARGYLRITDRIKDMFIVGGFNCYPAEIESIMLGHPEIEHVAVIGVPDVRMGEVGMAFVVPRVGKTLTPKEILRWCKSNMANYKVPRYVATVRELPVNAMNKVQKFVLRERAKTILR
jgi:acyl-CoA synthetase (AMP-forming)/AMP-acid ligase II